MKSYDLANEILLLWQANVNKSSGLINKDSLDISIVYEVLTAYENPTKSKEIG
jgi:hypothetical protein